MNTKITFKKIINPFINPYFLIFFLALMVRIIYLIWFFKFSGELSGKAYIPTSDRRVYDSISQSIAKGYGINWSNINNAYFPPFYPIFLSYLYTAIGWFKKYYLVVFGIQSFISALTCVLIFEIGKKLFNKYVGLISALTSIFYYPFYSVIGDLELENLLIFLSVLFCFFIIKSSFSKKTRDFIVSGTIGGLLTLTKPVFLLIVPFFGLLWLFFSKVKLKKILIFLAFFSLILGVWFFRNYLLYKKVFLSSQSGDTLWLVINSPSGTYTRMGARYLHWNKIFENDSLRNEYYTKTAISVLKNNYINYLKKIPINFNNLFTMNTSVDLSFILGIGSIIGVFFYLNTKKFKNLLFILLYFLFCLQYALLFAYPRFRFPLDWILIIFFSFAFFKITRAFILIINFNKKSAKYFSKFLDNKLTLKIYLFIYLLVIVFIILTLKISYKYFLPKTIRYPKLVEIQEKFEINIQYQDIFKYQKKNQGNISPFIGKIICWQGEINYLNRNTIYPLGSAKHLDENENPEYKDFYDIYFLLSRNYSTFDLIVNRGITPRYYGDGVVMVNYKGLIDFSYKNGDPILLIAKIVGQNHLGQIYLEGYKIAK